MTDTLEKIEVLRRLKAQIADELVDAPVDAALCWRQTQESRVEALGGAIAALPAAEAVAYPGDYALPCDVAVAPATVIAKGCTLKTLMQSISLRENADDVKIDRTGFRKLFPQSDPPTPPAQQGEVDRLYAAAKAYFDGYCVDEAEDTFECSDFGYNTGCTREQHEAAIELREALSQSAPLVAEGVG